MQLCARIEQRPVVPFSGPGGMWVAGRAKKPMAVPFRPVVGHARFRHPARTVARIRPKNLTPHPSKWCSCSRNGVTR